MKFNWPKYDIVKNVNGEDVLYLRRYFIFRSKWFNIFLHHIAMPDEDRVSHNHPWSWLGLVLRGGYTEARYSSWNKYTTVERAAGSVAFRKAEDFHKIISVKPSTWTLIFTGSVSNKQEWGFLEESGFVHWRKFLGITGEVDMD